MTPLRLGSHYQLEERIGEGGLGVVWRGSDTVTGAAYAIKLLRPEHAQDPATVARFVRERTALLRFRHPNVVVLHDMII
jgi:serine/threonine protein kinase